MATYVLKNRGEIDASRTELERMGVSCLDSWPVNILRRYGILGGINLGDRLKSWDILTTATFIRERLPRSAPILDIGAYASEILPALHRMGYASLAGVDLNPAVRLMPHANAIRYEVSDFMQTPFEDGSFDAVTAISVIEHGFDPPSLLGEISRLLRPGGYFLASFDYWPEKIDTTGTKIFGMDWRIFSKEEVLAFIEEGRAHKFSPCGEISLDAGEKMIHWGGKDYTFAWLALRKSE